MQYFIGIVPDEKYKRKVNEFRGKWKNNSLSEVVEPHITLKAQGGLTPDETWLGKVKEVCRNFKAFQIHIGDPMFFGEDILYLSADSQPLYELHKRIVRATAPSHELISKYFELDDFVPHMTLGKTMYGLTKRELKDMAQAAEKELCPYPTVEVCFVRVYKEAAMNRYVKLRDIQLGEG